MDSTTGKPNEMSIDIPAQDGTLLHLTLHRDGAGLFGGESQVEVQQHTAHGLRPLASYGAVALQEAAAWRPGGKSELRLHDQVPSLTIESHWLTTLTDWTLMAAETDLDLWSADA